MRRGRIAALRLLALAALLASPAAAQSAGDAVTSRAVIFMYSRFGEDAYPSSSIRLDLFEAHLQELKGGGYHVMPVPEIIAAIAAKRPLPENTVGITIDEAYRSVYTQAWPRLKKAGFPFTLFVATDSVDRGRGDTMSWNELRELAESGVTIGSLTASHPHLIEEDRAFSVGQILRANERFKSELGSAPTLFAYPYGEYTPELKKLVGALGFKAAFGQQSGVANSRQDSMELPRFAMNDAYGGIERFRTAAQALPLLVSNLQPDDMLLDDNPPELSFTVDPLMGDLSQLACFATGIGRASVIDAGQRRVEVRLAAPLPPGRVRLNCTLPAVDGRWRWFGAQFTAPDE
jgi:peptidoglycan/xylan/chitin deacetylase (PgdA/CDA1 family)